MRGPALPGGLVRWKRGWGTLQGVVSTPLGRQSLDLPGPFNDIAGRGGGCGVDSLPPTTAHPHS